MCYHGCIFNNGDSKIKVACLTHYYIEHNRAGGELMLHELLKALAGAGHEVTAFITDTVKLNNNIDGVNIVYASNPNHVLQTVKFDVVVSQFQNAIHGLNAGRLRGKPFVHIIHNDMWQTKIINHMMQPTDLAVFNTKWIKQDTITSAQQIVVRPPVDRKKFKTKSAGEYITLVNLTKPKGADLFFELARQMPDQKFLGVKGGYWKKDQMDCDLPNVTIIDNTADMVGDVYSKSKVILMPSSYETFGMVAAEAITSGIPVIATPTPGLKENLGPAGVYAYRGSNEINEWSQQLTKLLNNKKYYKEVSAQCVKQSKMINTKKELAGFVDAVEKVHVNYKSKI